MLIRDNHRHHCTLVGKMCRLDREEESQRSLSPGYQARRQPWTRWWWWRWWRRWWLRWWWWRRWLWWWWWWWWVRWWWWWLWWLYLYGQQEWEKGEVKSQCLPAVVFCRREGCYIVFCLGKLGNNRLQQTTTNCHILLKRADEELMQSWWRTEEELMKNW